MGIAAIVAAGRSSLVDAQESGETFGGGVVVKYFPWSVVEANGDICQVLGRVNGQVRVFREVLAQQPVGVFIRAALPW
jgi:hypothetical protein